MLRIGDKVSELELQLEPLKVQSEKAKKYLELKEELQGVEVAVWMDRLEKLSQDARKAEEDYTSAAFVLEQEKENLNKLYAFSAQMSADLRQQNGELDNIRVQTSMLEGAHQQIEGQIAVLRGAVQNNEENIRRSKEDLQGQETRRSGIAMQMEQAQQRIVQVEQTLTQKNEQLEESRRELLEMTANAQGITRQFMQLRSREVQLTSDLAAGEADLRSAESNLAQSQERIGQLRQDLSAGEEKQQQAALDLENCRKELKAAREEVTAGNNTIAGYTLRQATRAKRRDELAQKVQSIKTELESVQAKARVFRAMERDMEGFQKSVRCVMQEAKRGTLRNVHGPLSQLIRTEGRYTVAIEIALGAVQQHIVMDSKEDGKKALDYLKRTGNGRITVLPIATMKGNPLNEKGLSSCGGFVSIASDLIKCDEKYRDIVQYQLGRTVIVETIDDAIAMSQRYNNRFKIVTLDGQVMNPGGSMTGGSVNKEAGMLSRANELEKLTQKEKELTGKLEALEAEYGEARRLADQVEFQLTTAKEQLAEAEKLVLTKEGLEKQHEIWVQALHDAAESAQRELESLQKRQQTEREHCAAVAARQKLYGDQLNQVRLEIAQLEGAQSETDAAVAKHNDAMNAIRTEIAALEAERTTAQSHITDLRLLQSAAEGDRDRKLADMEAIRAEIAQLEEQIAAAQARQKDNDEQVQKIHGQMKAAQTEYARIEAEKTRTEGQIQDKIKTVMEMEKSCVLLQSKKENTAVEERTIIDKLWDSYSLTPGTAGEKRGEIESVAAGNRRIAELKRKIGALGTPNLGAIEEYARVNERYTYLTGQRDDVLGSKKELEGIIRSITQEMTTIFVSEFTKINEYFGQVFTEMFGGGKGELVLEDPQEPLTCGIEIRVQPPGKQLKTITLLSGGEKAFVAIALYFAILKVRPTPFCMLDEIDAALDDRNVERFANYLRNLSRKTQFIVITHRRGTMEASDVLYGVTMQEQGISKLLRLDLNQMEEQLGIME